jgi:peptide/nickel transport system substrate-binding protein
MILPAGCRTRSDAFVIALGDNIRTIDPIGSPSTEAASERVSTLIFNRLVKKDEKFDYVGDLASDINRSDDGLTFTFTLRDGVKFTMAGRSVPLMRNTRSICFWRAVSPSPPAFLKARERTNKVISKV